MRLSHGCGSWMWLLVVLCTVACGTDAPAPSITFTRIPPAAKGGPDVLDTIEGRVTGVQPGQRLVIYSRNSVCVHDRREDGDHARLEHLLASDVVSASDHRRSGVTA